MESPFARKPESAVRARLSRQELCGEAIYELTRRGKINQETFTARMQALDACGPDGAIGACYATWLLLRAQPESQERDLWMAANTMKLREAVRYLEASTSKDMEREAASSGSSTRDLVLSAFCALEWLIERPLFMNCAEIHLAR